MSSGVPSSERCVMEGHLLTPVTHHLMLSWNPDWEERGKSQFFMMVSHNNLYVLLSSTATRHSWSIEQNNSEEVLILNRYNSLQPHESKKNADQAHCFHFHNLTMKTETSTWSNPEYHPTPPIGNSLHSRKNVSCNNVIDVQCLQVKNAVQQTTQLNPQIHQCFLAQKIKSTQLVYWCINA